MTAPVVVAHTDDPDGTRALARAVARLLGPGDTVALSGELGAGKTCFVQGAAAGLGVTGPVTSPTFVLVRTYRGTVPVVHCDVYRLGRLQDVLDLGDDVFAPDAVTFVEWGDAVAALLPEDRLDVEVVHARPDDLDDERRRVELTLHGAWSGRRDELAAACATWTEDS